MGGNIDTGTQTSGLTIPEMKTAAGTIGSQLNTQLNKGVTPFTGSMVPALSSQTMSGISNLSNAVGNTGGLSAANNWATGTIASGGYNPALSQAQSGVQGYLAESAADAPGYQQMRQKAANDAALGVSSSFLTDGRYGSDIMGQAAGEAIGNTLASMDYQNYGDRLNRQLAGNQALAGIGQTAFGNAAGASSMLPGLYSTGIAGANAGLAGGQIMDAYNTAQAQDQARIFDATQNAGWNTLQRGAGILAGTAPSAGTTSTTTSSQQVPWWQTGLGIGAGLLSFM